MTNDNIRRERDSRREEIKTRIDNFQEEEVKNEIRGEAVRIGRPRLICQNSGGRVHDASEGFPDGSATCRYCGERLEKQVVDVLYDRATFMEFAPRYQPIVR